MADHVGFSALHIDTDGRGHFYGSRFVGARAAQKFVQLAERDGLLTPADADHPEYVVLDLLDEDGDIIADRAVPTAEAWAAVNSELALTVVAVEP